MVPDPQSSGIMIFENDNGSHPDWFPTNANDFDTFIAWNYWSHFKTGDNKHVFTTSGTVNLIPDPSDKLPLDWAQSIRAKFRGNASEFWTDAWLRIWVSLPNQGIYNTEGDNPQMFHVDNAVPIISINGIDKGPDNHNGGWQVYNFGHDALKCGWDRNTNGNDQIAIWAHMGVRGALFQLTRVGYSLTLVGDVVARQY